ncbi:MAG TPA: YsnF/AvaK domain-containing protein [Pyrinomonadaceae bacterium]|nr:YsnF/AvaK domain-containing protein [Pyrinomonadaceae bacterium]
MSEQRARTLVLTDKDGLRGFVDESAAGDGRGQILVRLEDGRQVLVPAEELRVEEGGGFYLPFSLSELMQAAPRASGARRGRDARDDGDTVVVPIVAEQLEVQKRKVEAGGVRIRKTVSEREEVVDEPLMREEVQVRRVPVNRVVDGPVPVRHVGNTMIVSLMEEVLVVEKRLVLKEELHITKEQVESYRPQRVRLRTEKAVIERVDDGGGGYVQDDEAMTSEGRKLSDV